MAEKNNFAVICNFYDDYIAGLKETHAKGYAEGLKSLATEILMVLDEYPNNVERIERIKEVCNEIINNKKQED